MPIYRLNYIISREYLFIIGFIILFSICGCSYHWYWYKFDPYTIEKNDWEIELFFRHVDYSELEKKYMPSREATSDTLFKLSILYKFNDSLSLEEKDIQINNVMIQIDSGQVLHDLTIDTEISNARLGSYNVMVVKPFRFSGPTPQNIYVDLDLTIIDKNTGQEVSTTTIRTQANRTKKSKSFFEGH